MNKLKILVIEDDKLTQKVMAKYLGGHNIEFAEDRASAEKKLESADFNICFIDLKLGGNDDYSGLKLIPMASSKGVYSVIMSSCDSEDIVNKAHELGCNDFYVKGNEETNIGKILAKYLQAGSSKSTDDIFSNKFVTEDKSTRTSIKEALKYATSELPILILGPSGTGKTCLAKIIHDHSHREGEFVSINCSAYTEDLLEAELFGYKKGAFTGANENRKGKLLQAHSGTLFLDEIGSMSLNMQTKLLKAIEERSFYPVGAEKPEHSEFRIISATLEDLQKLLAQSKLRFDFFQRVHGFTINLKPLSLRKDDMFPLIQHFTHSGKRLSFTPEAKTFLLEHRWPGNIRELKKFIELTVSGSEGTVTLEHAERHITQAVHQEPDTAATFLTQKQYAYAIKHGLNQAIDFFAYEIIKRNLSENNEKKTKTLAALKISTRLLYSTLKKGHKK